MQTLRHLVIGTDFSECAERALAMAIVIALATGARLTVVHVCEPGLDYVDDERLASCAETLSALVERAAHHRRVEISTVVRFGSPSHKLENVATEVGAGLIVVGRHGAGLGASLGAVAALLVRTANRPVLTVPCDALAAS